MLMQPSPIADTSRLLFPSSRFCIVQLRCLVSKRVVLFVADLLHPLNWTSIQRLLNGDMRHRRRRRRAMPMLFTGRDPHHVAGPEFLYGAAPTLHPAEAECDDQRLT